MGESLITLLGNVGIDDKIKLASNSLKNAIDSLLRRGKLETSALESLYLINSANKNKHSFPARYRRSNTVYFETNPPTDFWVRLLATEEINRVNKWVMPALQ